MSTTHTATLPAQPVRTSLVAWIAGGLMTVCVLAALTVALWPMSEADKAREDGRDLGQAVSHLYYADSSTEVDSALAEIDAAAASTADHAGDRVAEQVNAQADALDRAVNGYVGALTTDDAFEQDLYQSELDYAVTDLSNNASDFQDEGPEVRQAFWDGFEDGFDNG
jgi:hypothetical protein